MKQPKISIIIPAYNIEKYLDKCLESVCAQTLQEIEIILIDDGSTDSTPAKCDAWGKKDGRIKVIHQQNKGLAETCNVGLEISTAPYVGFVDSDDWVAPDMFETMYASIKEYDSDISVCGINIIKENGVRKRIRCKWDKRCWDRKSALILLLMDDKMPNYRWNKLYRKELFEGIRFPESRLFEDLSTVYRVYQKASRVSHTGLNSYFYLQRAGSILHTLNLKKEIEYSEIIIERLDFILKSDLFSATEKKWLKVFPLKSLVNAYYYLGKMTPGSAGQREKIKKVLLTHYRSGYNPHFRELHKILLSLCKRPMRWSYQR